MKHLLLVALCCLITLSLGAAAPLSSTRTSAVNLLQNAGFEDNGDLSQSWGTFWARVPSSGEMALDNQSKHGGQSSLRVTHRGVQDWSVGQTKTLSVQAGDILQIGAWLRCDHVEEAAISVVARRPNGDVLNWMQGQIETSGTHDWQHFGRRFVVPAGCASVQFRLTGSGAGTVWMDDAELVALGNVNSFGAVSAQPLTLSNALLEVRLNPQPQNGGAFSVVDRRNGRTWKQQPFGADIILRGAKLTTTAGGKAPVALLDLWDVANDLNLRATLRLSADKPELAVAITGENAHAMDVSTAWPQPFTSGAGTSLVVPLNEGILYPVDDASIDPMSLVAYSGHGLSMPWFGVVDNRSGAGTMAILNTPDDARIDIARNGVDEKSPLLIRPQWDASRQKWNYERRLTYVFFAQGGYVAQAKRYREYSKSVGLFKTLTQKTRENPNVDRLIGAVNVWNWDMDKVALCREMKSLGMDRVLWSSGANADELKQINALGFLSSRYDIYQDVYPPDAPSYLNREGWPQDLVRLPNGDWMKGWMDIETKADGSKVEHQGGVICSSQQLKYAKERVPAELATHPYLCRFIDTTTASPWRECYDPAHPLTRSGDRQNKMALLNYFSHDLKQVVGTETGIDPSVPFVDYYEGMMSLAPYRLPDAGREMLRPEEATPDLLKFQVGSFYRVPLWELVYHDCIVSDWYWGDYNNKVASVWNRRNLFNILYGTPPMFMFDRATWARDKARFVQSYRDICPLVRRLGNDELLSHEFLTSDHAVQRTIWKSSTRITVNFSNKPFTTPDGKVIQPMNWLVQ